MSQQNETFRKLTVGLPLTEQENAAFSKMVLQTGLKKQIYMRNLLIADMKAKGWLPQNQEEKAVQTAAKEV